SSAVASLCKGLKKALADLDGRLDEVNYRPDGDNGKVLKDAHKLIAWLMGRPKRDSKAICKSVAKIAELLGTNQANNPARIEDSDKSAKGRTHGGQGAR